MVWIPQASLIYWLLILRIFVLPTSFLSTFISFASSNWHMKYFSCTVIIPGAKNPSRARACQQAVGMTSTYPQTEVNDHPVNYRNAWSKKQVPQRCWFLDRNYRYKSVYTQITHDAKLAQFPYKVSLSLGIVPAPHPIVHIQSSTP